MELSSSKLEKLLLFQEEFFELKKQKFLIFLFKKFPYFWMIADQIVKEKNLLSSRMTADQALK